MVKCLRQGGRRGRRGGQAGRVGVVRRLLQGLDQVVPVLRVYGPQGAFAYALKDKTGQDRTGQGGTLIIKISSSETSKALIKNFTESRTLLKENKGIK